MLDMRRRDPQSLILMTSHVFQVLGHRHKSTVRRSVAEIIVFPVYGEAGAIAVVQGPSDEAIPVPKPFLADAYSAFAVGRVAFGVWIVATVLHAGEQSGEFLKVRMPEVNRSPSPRMPLSARSAIGLRHYRFGAGKEPKPTIAYAKPLQRFTGPNDAEILNRKHSETFTSKINCVVTTIGVDPDFIHGLGFLFLRRTYRPSVRANQVWQFSSQISMLCKTMPSGM